MWMRTENVTVHHSQGEIVNIRDIKKISYGDINISTTKKKGKQDRCYGYISGVRKRLCKGPRGEIVNILQPEQINKVCVEKS